MIQVEPLSAIRADVAMQASATCAYGVICLRTLSLNSTAAVAAL